MNAHLISYYIGIFIVFATHIYILVNSKQPIPAIPHASINLLAAAMIAYYFMNKEQFIKF